MRILQIVVFVLTASATQAQQAIPFQIFNGKGKKVSYAKMLAQSEKSDITFFGEYHNNAVAHWLQLELTQDLAKSKKNALTLGFEMFEADQQHLVDQWLNGGLNDKQFQDTMRMWTNYKTDYKPLMLLAKTGKMPVAADNVPRRIASAAFKLGREGLINIDAKEKAFMADAQFPIDTTLSQYQAMMDMVGADHSKGYNFVLAQAIKDATMAHFIDKLWKPGTHFIHFNGAFHTDYHQGIIWYLNRLRPNLNYVSISTVEQSDVRKLDKEHLNRAHFIIVVKDNFTKTH